MNVHTPMSEDGVCTIGRAACAPPIAAAVRPPKQTQQKRGPGATAK